MGGSGGPRASIAEGFRSRFWLPPRPHGQAIEDRTVSFLELFYDLVFVVVVAQAAHTLAHHLSWDGAADFAVVFGLIWIAWLNGTLHHEIHGHEDGRSRTFIFVQMTVLVVLAIYTGDATGEGGSGFALTYAVLLAVLTWLWYAVRRQDDGEYRSATDPYIAGMAVSTVVVAGSAALDDQARVVVWGLLVIAWVLGGIVNVWTSGGVTASGVTATDSMAERFGLFTIIVLGEVVVGVATGLSVVDRDALSVGTGVLALMIGFGFWWTYFDFVGRRVPRREGLVPAVWVYLHLPATMAIAAAGAAMVGLLGFAEYRHFGLAEMPQPELADFRLLQSLQDEKLSFIVTPIKIDSGEVAREDLEDAALSVGIPVDSAAFVLIVTIRPMPEGSNVTVNLRAPVVIDVNRAIARQVVMANSSYPIQQPIQLLRQG